MTTTVPTPAPPGESLVTTAPVSTVSVELIPDGHKARYPELATETFAFVHRVVGAEQDEILGTDEDVPARVTPEVFAERLVVEVRKRYPDTELVPTRLAFRRRNGCWSAATSATSTTEPEIDRDNVVRNDYGERQEPITFRARSRQNAESAA